MLAVLKMLFLVILQNASFTLVSRARNSKSLWYHTIASVLSNGIWLLVIRQVVLNFDKPILMWTYLAGSVIGSVLMHHIAMKYFEKDKKLKTKPAELGDSIDFMIRERNKAFIPAKVEEIDNDLLRKYLSPKSKKIVTTTVNSTAIEVLEGTSEGTVLFEENKALQRPGVMRKVYMVQFLTAVTLGKPGRREIKKFCDHINEVVYNGDFIIGSLGMPSYMKLYDGRYIMFHYAVSPKSFTELKAKYPFFAQEGCTPDYVIL